MHRRKWLVAVLAVASLCLLGIAPASAHAATTPTTGHAAPAILRSATVSPLVSICTGTATIGTSGWGAVTATAYTHDCAGTATAVLCHSQVDFQAESGLTNGWTTQEEGSSVAGCTSAGASIVSLPCESTPGTTWSYRAVGYFSVHWSDGSTTTGSGISTSISGTHHCFPLA